MDECMKYGSVEKLYVDIQSEGFVWCQYKEIDEAMTAQEAFDSMYFRGKKLACNFISESVFKENVAR